MLQQARDRLAEDPDVSEDMKARTDLRYGNVMEPLPWQEETFDAIFHVNVYYFWPNCTQALTHLTKVLKPGGRIVTTLNREALDMVVERGVFTEHQTDAHATYLEGLKLAGFKNISIDDGLVDDATGRPYHLISATKPE